MFPQSVVLLRWANERGQFMDHYVEDNSKQRLTDRLDIIAAINILRSQGYDHEDLILEITRIFYIDLDEYNDILAHAA
jgi:hypothetical protein